MGAESISAAVVVLLVAAFLWLTGASAKMTLVVPILCVAGIVLTAVFWNLLITSDS